MSYRVYLQPNAMAAIERLYREISGIAPVEAQHWFNAFNWTFYSIGKNPSHSRRAPESVYLRRDTREVSHGRPPFTARVRFVVEGEEIHIIHVSLEPIKIAELGEGQTKSPTVDPSLF